MKKFLCLIALLFASAGLVGCVVPGVTPGGATGKTTITFWHAMGQSNQVIIQEMIDSFEKAYPMFEVEQYSQGGYTDLRDKILNSIPVGEAPTIAQAYPDHIANYLNAKAAQELDSYIDNTKALSDYANLHADFATYTEQVGYTAADKADFVDAFYAEGAVYDTAKTMYCVPFNKSTEVLFYNLDFFQAHAADLAKYGVAADGSWTKPTWEQVEK
jgi:multiple sugar transport system substrate-binding protein